MIGSNKWNISIAAISLLLTFMLSISNNPWTTSVMRSCYAFVIVFVLIYAVRFVLGTIAGMNTLSASGGHIGHDIPESSPGASVDLATPDDEELLTSMLKQPLTGAAPANPAEFEPLHPQRLVTKADQTHPELLARSLREMSEE